MFVISVSIPASAIEQNYDSSKSYTESARGSTIELARLTIYSYYNSSSGSGHAFISIKNNMTTSITIGVYTIKPNEEITIGTWGLNDHSGIWYNKEAYGFSSDSSAVSYFNIYSVHISLDYSDFATINTFINNNDTWTSTNSCCSFARRLWNSVSAIDISSTGTNPQSLANAIRAIGGIRVYSIPSYISGTSKVGYAHNGNMYETL